MADVTLVDGFELKIEVDGAPGPPVRLKCRHLTGPERHKIMHMEVQSGSGDPRVTQTVDAEALIKASILEIEDCQSGGEDITTARQFNGPGIPAQLYDQAVNLLITKNRRADLKN